VAKVADYVQRNQPDPLVSIPYHEREKTSTLIAGIVHARGESITIQIEE
jgi:hypothetical protein